MLMRLRGEEGSVRSLEVLLDGVTMVLQYPRK